MAKRKGMSLEEKRTVVMHFLWETVRGPRAQLPRGAGVRRTELGQVGRRPRRALTPPPPHRCAPAAAPLQKSVFNMKELEKEASKRGVVAQTVEEVVKSLVDDRLVECEKIGSGNFYWSFPSKAYVNVRGRRWRRGVGAPTKTTPHPQLTPGTHRVASPASRSPLTLLRCRPRAGWTRTRRRRRRTVPQRRTWRRA
jgi:hypothetical protein